MADISMCANELCPSRFTCYRFIAKPSDRQSYIMGKKTRPEEECPYFWQADDRDLEAFNASIGKGDGNG